MKGKNFEVITLKIENISDFAHERNLLLSRARAPWVFFLDSDEKFSPALKKEIERLDPGDYNGFYIRRKNYFCGQYVGEDKIIRLGKKSAGKWERPVHEIWKIKSKVKILKNPLIHNTAGNLADYIKKINSYSTLHALANKKEEKHASLFKIIFYPGAKFIQNFLKSRNFVFSLMQSFHSYLAWSKLWILQHETR